MIINIRLIQNRVNALFDIVRREVSKHEYCNWARYRNCGSHCSYNICKIDSISIYGYIQWVCRYFTGSAILLLNVES